MASDSASASAASKVEEDSKSEEIVDTVQDAKLAETMEKDATSNKSAANLEVDVSKVKVPSEPDSHVEADDQGVGSSARPPGIRLPRERPVGSDVEDRPWVRAR